MPCAIVKKAGLKQADICAFTFTLMCAIVLKLAIGVTKIHVSIIVQNNVFHKQIFCDLINIL